ncbi:hypothetical protein [Mobilicoccus pelagius]|uniref:Uncharacterized protein n=1 Tax=Mobilicoccus pelagius NBRC 104925 TaxID=1089455 RepID=H5UTC1_9MICO|nr:hypothetical protein [Mobilicoccus pelagius]GAB48979.1 hypothetical protein MOPEL_091_00240 [Mobilicoccus pelagius NBRC 104925]
MLTPRLWAFVVGGAFAFVAVAGLGMILLGGEGGFAWVLVGFAAASAAVAFVVAARSGTVDPGGDALDDTAIPRDPGSGTSPRPGGLTDR